MSADAIPEPRWRENRDAWTQVPGVTELAEPTQCTGWHSASTGKRACKLPARWHFETQVDPASYLNVGDSSYFEKANGDYCHNHLWSRGVLGGNAESWSFDQWHREHPEWQRWVQR